MFYLSPRDQIFTDLTFTPAYQEVLSSFINISKPDYRHKPPAMVSQKELCKLEFMARDSLAIINCLTTFASASETVLNQVRDSRDSRQRLMEQLMMEMDPAVRD